jgi:flagellar biosynthesis protein FlhB
MSGSNRTHPATQRRLQKAREQGDIPLSREVVSFVSFSGGCAAILFFSTWALQVGLPILRGLIAESFDRQLIEKGGLVQAGVVVMQLSAPSLGLAMLGGVIAALAQTRALFRVAALQPNVSRINPVNGVKRLFGPDGLIELAKSILKLGLMGVGTWYVLGDRLKEVVLLPLRDFYSMLLVIKDSGFKLLMVAGAVQAIAAVGDFAVVRIRYALRHRMSREDLKDEYKETEGNPFTKSRIRRLQRRRRRRLVADVPKATVVVTNPTHYAVALLYDQELGKAPVVIAKGADLVAQRIRELAIENEVPIVENPPLARALFRLELDDEIPAEHFKTVAEIIAFVWKIKGRTPRLKAPASSRPQ